jgi:hypothetical protein
MSDSYDDFTRSIPFSIRRGVGQEPADRAPKRGSVTGIGDRGQRVVHVPGEGVHDMPSTPPEAIPVLAPTIPPPVSSDEDQSRARPALSGPEALFAAGKTTP